MLQKLQRTLLPPFINFLRSNGQNTTGRRLKFSDGIFAVFGLLFSFTSFSQTVSISSSVSSVVEGTGPVLAYTVSLDNGAINTTGGPITGTIAWTGTATNGTDYIGPATFAIANGSNSIGILVQVLDDAVCEPSETVIATVTSVSVGGVNPVNNSITGTIFDDDCGSILISIGSPVDATESPVGTPAVTFTISIVSGGPSAVPITGTIGYAGTATGGVDYSGANTYTIPAGSLSTTISLPVNDDFSTEPTETVIANLTGSPSIGTYANTTSTAHIYDDDAANVSISIGSPTDGMEGGNFVSYVVSLDFGQINSSGSPITGTINYTGTATNLTDYTAVLNFSIPDGVGSQLVILPVLDDLLLECNETVIATISSPSLGVINPTAASSTANIIDDECAQTGISIGSAVDGTEGVSDVSFDVFLENGAINNTGSAITGTIGFTGTADGMDVTNLPLGFSIPAGANSTTIVVTVVDDICIELTETVIATISNPNFGVIGNATSTANIIDNDSGAMSISIGNPVDGAEGGGNVNFTISIDGGLTNCTGGPITGTLALTGTATNNADYVGVSTFTIPDGSSSSILDIVVIDDLIDECDETVIATILTSNLGTISAANTSTAIIDDDECTNDIDPLTGIELDVYPNPATSVLHVGADKQISAYAILDLKGRTLSANNVNAKEFMLNMEFLSAGSYMITITFDDGIAVTKKIMKE